MSYPGSITPSKALPSNTFGGVTETLFIANNTDTDITTEGTITCATINTTGENASVFVGDIDTGGNLNCNGMFSNYIVTTNCTVNGDLELLSGAVASIVTFEIGVDSIFVADTTITANAIVMATAYSNLTAYIDLQPTTGFYVRVSPVPIVQCIVAWFIVRH
jgi:hypothetical protein